MTNFFIQALKTGYLFDFDQCSFTKAWQIARHCAMDANTQKRY